MTTMKVVVGKPGTGKSTKLIQDAIDMTMQGKSVFIMTPTHTAKSNLVRGIRSRWVRENNKNTSSRFIKRTLDKLEDSVHVLYGYSGEDVVLIDEISMVEMTHFEALLHKANRLKDIQIVGYGDVKQLPTPKGHSVAEILFRNNIKDDFWEWVKEAYDENLFSLIPPTNWGISGMISTTVMMKNLRLKEGDYDTNHINSLINNSIESEWLYQETLIDGLEKYSLIITPTHKRGDRVNEYVRSYYMEHGVKEINKVFPFIKTSDKKVFLNPDYSKLDKLQKAYRFIKLPPQGTDLESAKLSAYITVDSAQGATVDNVIYFMGDTPIPNNKHKYHYNINRFYTAITRGRNPATLVGNIEDMRGHLDIFPASPQEEYKYRVADFAKDELFNKLYTSTTEISREEIYELYLSIFENYIQSSDVTEEMGLYGVISTPYEIDMLMTMFKEYDYDYARLSNLKAIDYRFLYTEQVHKTNSESKQGRGKIQQFILSLSRDELSELKVAIESLSKKGFYDEYELDKESVKKALKSVDVILQQDDYHYRETNIAMRHKNNNNKKSAKSKGAGSTQRWLSDLSESQLAELRRDFNVLTQKDFKSKYAKDKKNIKRVLEKV